MARKTVGFVELEWTCRQCGTRNPGTQKSCSSCGAAMGEEGQFELPSEQELIADQEKLAEAERAPDIHCPYCGARNRAGSERCSQCSGSLVDGKTREKGRVMGAFKTEPVPEMPCPFCGTPNPAKAVKCKKCGGNLKKAPAVAPLAQPAKVAATSKSRLGIGATSILAFLCIIAAAILIFGSRTSDTTAVVQSVWWQRSVPIMEMRPVEYEAWADEIPSSAQRGSCGTKHRRTVQEPVAGAEEVCGTPYTIDQGTGIGKVVQDCEYRIYDQWCTYSVSEWTAVDMVAAEGTDLNPRWPLLAPQSNQREGDRWSESYLITFRVEDENDTYEYKVDTAGEFAGFAVGSRWTLKVNTFGNVTDVQPAR